MSNEMQDSIEDRKDLSIPSGEPTQETFDLDDFIQERSTVPVIGVTLYLDADGGVQLEEAQNLLAAVSQRLSDLEAQPNPVLNVGEENPHLAAKMVAEAEQQRLQAEVEALTKRVVDSALYLEFQAAAQEAVVEAQSKADLTNEPGVTTVLQQSILRITYVAAAICLRITNAKGQVIPAPIMPVQIAKIRAKLIQAEDAKILTAINKAVETSNEWATKLDAGFPGRSTDAAS